MRSLEAVPPAESGRPEAEASAHLLPKIQVNPSEVGSGPTSLVPGAGGVDGGLAGNMPRNGAPGNPTGPDNTGSILPSLGLGAIIGADGGTSVAGGGGPDVGVTGAIGSSGSAGSAGSSGAGLGIDANASLSGSGSRGSGSTTSAVDALVGADVGSRGVGASGSVDANVGSVADVKADAGLGAALGGGGLGAALGADVSANVGGISADASGNVTGNDR